MLGLFAEELWVNTPSSVPLDPGGEDNVLVGPTQRGHQHQDHRKHRFF